MNVMGVSSLKCVVFAGDRYHDGEVFREVLLEVLKSQIGSFHLLEVDRDIEEALRLNPDLLVIARWNLNEDDTCWLNEESCRSLELWVKDGGKLFVWHSGLSRYPARYVELVGGRFIFHPERTVVKYFMNSGFSFEIFDEHYFVELRKGVEVFLWSESSYGRSTAGWRKTFGNGKILALTPAHDGEGLKSEGFRKVLERTLAWLLQGS